MGAHTLRPIKNPITSGKNSDSGVATSKEILSIFSLRAKSNVVSKGTRIRCLGAREREREREPWSLVEGSSIREGSQPWRTEPPIYGRVGKER